ncbi:hypothetical protein C8R45DRAFT_982412, partial [Mycena sanguinolenta]
MDSKLKSLKVADLKDILAKANQPPPPKATKADLITRILASPDATDVYNAKFGPKDDLLAPPEDLDWDVDQAPEPAPVAKPAKPASAAKPVPPPAPPPAAAAVAPASEPAPKTDAPPPSDAKPTEDLELEKRRQRAERFGIPLVESKTPVVKKTKAAAPAPAPAKIPDANEKLDARAARFGTGQKRPAPTEVVDAEEQERRRKRAERFGTATA